MEKTPVEYPQDYSFSLDTPVKKPPPHAEVTVAFFAAPYSGKTEGPALRYQRSFDL
jgi:hypothetical protein